MRKGIAWLAICVFFTFGSIACGGGSTDSVPSNDTSTYAIWGIVTSSGAGLQGVTVLLNTSATATTDANGTYAFTGLLNGNYTITPSKTGYTFSPESSAQTVNGSDMVAVDFAGTADPSPTYSISGTVTSSGAELPGVTLTLNSSATATSDASGNYTFAGLSNGSYIITPSKTGYTFSPESSAQTVNGSDMVAVDFAGTADPSPMYRISGTVTLSDTGLQDVTLTLNTSATATTDAGGNYIFTGLVNGDYTITPSKTNYIFSPKNSAQTVNGSDITAVDFTAQGCTAPYGSVIIIDPSSQAWDTGGFGAGQDLQNDWTVTISDSDGTVMPKVCVTISASHAVPSVFNDFQFQFYPSSTVPNSPVDSGFIALTDDNGQYTFSTLISAGTGTFNDTIYAVSGTNLRSAYFEIK